MSSCAYSTSLLFCFSVIYLYIFTLSIFSRYDNLLVALRVAHLPQATVTTLHRMGHHHQLVCCTFAIKKSKRRYYLKIVKSFAHSNCNGSNIDGTDSLIEQNLFQHRFSKMKTISCPNGVHGDCTAVEIQDGGVRGRDGVKIECIINRVAAKL